MFGIISKVDVLRAERQRKQQLWRGFLWAHKRAAGNSVQNLKSILRGEIRYSKCLQNARCRYVPTS